MRITRDNIDYYLKCLNTTLKEVKASYFYVVVRRYGYYAIEQCNYKNTGAKDIRTGLSNRECYNIIYSMNEAVYSLIKEVLNNER